MAEPSCNGPTRDDHLDFAPWHTPQVSPCGFWLGKVLAGRNPILLLRFAGPLSLRLAERAFNASLLNEPPRNRRLYGRRPAEDVAFLLAAGRIDLSRLDGYIEDVASRYDESIKLRRNFDVLKRSLSR